MAVFVSRNESSDRLLAYIATFDWPNIIAFLLIQPPQLLTPAGLRGHIRAHTERNDLRISSQLVDASNQPWAVGDTLDVLVLDLSQDLSLEASRCYHLKGPSMQGNWLLRYRFCEAEGVVHRSNALIRTHEVFLTLLPSRCRNDSLKIGQQVIGTG